MSAESTSTLRSALPLSPQAIEDLVDGIAQLSRTAASRSDFYQALLRGAVRGCRGRGGRIWEPTELGSFQLVAAEGLPAQAAAQARSTGAKDKLQPARVSTSFLTQLEAAARTTDIRCLPLDDSSGWTAAGAPGSSRGSCYLVPIRVDDEPAGVLEVAIDSAGDRSADDPRHLLSVLAELAAEWHRNQQLNVLRGRAASWNKLESFAERVHKSTDLSKVALRVVNDGRYLVGCDRLSLAYGPPRRAKIIAVSGTDHVDRRSSVIYGMERMIRTVGRTGETVHYPMSAEELPPQIEAALDSYVDESQARRLAIVPLRAPREDEPTTDDLSAPPAHSRRTKEPPIIGLLIVEDFGEPADPQVREERTAFVARHAAIAVSHAAAWQRLPLAALWRMWSRSRVFWTGGRLIWLAIVAAAIAAAVIALVVVPVDFTIESRGELVPAERAGVFAPADGLVDAVDASEGKAVTDGQLLIQLSRPELDFEFARVRGELSTAEQRLSAIESTRLSNRGASTNESLADRARLAAEEEELKVQIKGLEEQRALLDRQQAQLRVGSPLAGRVLSATEEIDALSGRPVRRGDRLLVVGKLDGAWQLDLQVPDNSSGHVLQAAEEHGLPLDVSFVLATDPTTRYPGRLEKLGLATETDDESPYLRATVAIDSIPADVMRPGASVIARIDCGQRAAGYVWLRELFEAIERRFWVF